MHDRATSGSPSRFQLTSPSAATKPQRPDTKNHVAMQFRFSGIHRAYAFASALRKLDLPGEVGHDTAWFVRTDTRCLAQAEKFMHLIYGAENGGAR